VLQGREEKEGGIIIRKWVREKGAPGGKKGKETSPLF